MAIKDNINKIRLGANMSQEQFAEFIGVSRQAVQKWESGTSVPELDKLVKISKYFAIPLDTLVLDREERFVEEMTYNKTVKPNYAKMDNRDIYASELQTEYQQCIEEGLDISLYAEIFNAVNRLPQDEVKKKLGDVLYSIVLNAKTVEGYKYIEPSTLDEIRALRKTYMELPQVDYSRLRDKITGAWMGRICGCLLGKTVEGCKTDELIPFLKETGNYPMHRYIFRSDLNDDIINRYKYQFASRCYADTSDGMPVDDDTNYVVLAQELIQKYGKDFTAYDVAKTWTDLQSVSAYWTAERVAYRNFFERI